MATELRARDGNMFTDPHQTNVEVVVMVTDVNDNGPVFSQENYYITMEEGLSNQIILQVNTSSNNFYKSAIVESMICESFLVIQTRI